VQQHGYASKRSRSQLKAYVTHLAEELYIYRSLPLGQDRRRNRYWQFVASASRNDPCSGRIFVELHGGNWRVIDSEEVISLVVVYAFIS
jgi:acetyl esterase/lipase